MITRTPLPDMKQLIKKRNRNLSFCEGGKQFLYSESWMSIYQILYASKTVKAAEKISIWLPDYFCMETVSKLEESWMEILFYPVTERLVPNWKKLKDLENTSPDFFLFVHYFGHKREVEKARGFCDKNGCYLIEDCTHLMYSCQKMGKSGDFVIYSPHKCIGVADGAILSINMDLGNEKTELVGQMEVNYYKLPRKGFPVIWYLKKGIQFLTRKNRYVPFEVACRYGVPQSKKSNMTRVSFVSEHILYSYLETRLREYSAIRRKNVELYTELIKKIDEKLINLTDNQTEIPYYAVYSLEKVVDKEHVIQELTRKGLLLQNWPDLPGLLKNDEILHEKALQLSRNLFFIPCHQTIRPQEIACRYNLDKKSARLEKTDTMEIHWNVSREQWERLFNDVKNSNILQEWEYGEIKAETEGWRADKGIICLEGMQIGVVQVLAKAIMGHPVLIRLNRGPLFISGYDNSKWKVKVLLLIKKHYGKVSLMLCAPSIEASLEGFTAMSNINWKSDFSSAHSSIRLDLTQTVEVLQKNMKSKWRNQLRAAQKAGLDCREGSEDFEQLLELYEEDKRNKNYKGTPHYILRRMYEKKLKNLLTLSAYCGREMIAFDIIYTHGNSATYLVGWNGSEGRKVYANHFLLFEAIVLLKDRGFLSFDLGGVDDIHTEAIASFKKGVGGEFYQYVGESMKI